LHVLPLRSRGEAPLRTVLIGYGVFDNTLNSPCIKRKHIHVPARKALQNYTLDRCHEELITMDTMAKTAFVIAVAIAVVLHMLFGGSRMAGAVLNGGMTGSAAMGGMSWMWIPALLLLGSVVLSIWILFGQKK